jgi:hypothetical protein
MDSPRATTSGANTSFEGTRRRRIDNVYRDLGFQDADEMLAKARMSEIGRTGTSATAVSTREQPDPRCRARAPVLTCRKQADQAWTSSSLNLPIAASSCSSGILPKLVAENRINSHTNVLRQSMRKDLKLSNRRWKRSTYAGPEAYDLSHGCSAEPIGIAARSCCKVQERRACW